MREMRNVRYLVVVIAAFVYFDGGRDLAAAPPPPICSDVCDSSTACDEICYENMMEFENGNDINCLEYGVYDQDQFCCGDSLCNLEANESCDACQDDCGTCCPDPDIECGNGQCEVGEECSSCSFDCGPCADAGGSCNNNDECDDNEPKECDDCLKTNVFCEDDTDCDTLDDHICVDDRCVLRDFPAYTNTCSDDLDCSTGEKCKLKCGFNFCPSGSCCSVCLPPWAA